MSEETREHLYAIARQQGGFGKFYKGKYGKKIIALICAYDYIVFGAIKKLRECGYHIPEDVSVIGIDNIAAGRFTQTTLTTIDTLPKERCAIAWELLHKKLQNKSFKAKQSIVIKPRLILRDSIGHV